MVLTAVSARLSPAPKVMPKL